uniref:WD repeat-containing protein 62-like isoform X2 n=1 Tax=Oncorhynchus gorbuscha TaxID=8017 RepID=UPI001EAF3B16|nr:WD repeat-containing protein 62-like isoform X2 [Oncorhynchus gorbuscha]
MKKCFKGSTSDDGTLLKVQMDPAGIYLATSCSDKSICIFDYESGECVATLFGHSEIVTGMRFSQDCRHLITISGDSCVFLWRLDSQMTNSMRKRLAERKRTAGVTTTANAPTKEHLIRRETFISVPLGHLPQTGEEEEEDDPRTPARCDITHDFLALDPMVPQTNGKLPMWARKLGPAAGTTVLPAELQPAHLQPRGRWAEHLNPLAIRSVLETHSLQRPLSPTPRRAEGPGEEEEEEEDEEEDSYFHPQSLDSLLGEEEEEEDVAVVEEEEDVVEEEEDVVEEEEDVVEEEEDVVEDDDNEDQGSGCLQRPGFLALPDSDNMFGPGLSSYVLYPANSTTLSTGGGEGEFGQRQQGWGGEDELSPDSACCVGSAESQDQPQDDTDSLSQVSSTGSSGVEEEEEDPQTLLRQHFDTMANHLSNEERFETDLSSLQSPPIETESLFLNPRFSISTRFLSRFQSRLRGPGSALRPAPLPPSITEEPSSHSSPDPTPSLNTTQANSKQFVVSSTTESVQEESQTPDVSDKTLRSQSSSPSSSSGSTLKPSQPGLDKEPLPRLPRQRYMGTTTSSRAKRSQGEGLNISRLRSTLLGEDHGGERLIPPGPPVRYRPGVQGESPAPCSPAPCSPAPCSPAPCIPHHHPFLSGASFSCGEPQSQSSSPPGPGCVL